MNSASSLFVLLWTGKKTLSLKSIQCTRFEVMRETTIEKMSHTVFQNPRRNDSFFKVVHIALRVTHAFAQTCRCSYLHVRSEALAISRLRASFTSRMPCVSYFCPSIRDSCPRRHMTVERLVSSCAEATFLIFSSDATSKMRNSKGVDSTGVFFFPKLVS